MKPIEPDMLFKNGSPPLSSCGILLLTLQLILHLSVPIRAWAAPAAMGGWSDLMSRQKVVTPATQAPSKALTISGKVVDITGTPLAGAVVELYKNENRPFMDDSDLKPLHSLTTSVSGTFEFELPSASATLFAYKEGLAPACKSFWNPNQDVKDEILTLTPPAVLLGIVVDESDKPVADADVWVTSGYFSRQIVGESQAFLYVNALPRKPGLSARTGADGKFRIAGCPTNACVDLAVNKAGKALRPLKREYISPETMRGSPGQEEIKLVLDPAGTIEGKVIIGENGQPLAGARLVLASQEPNLFGPKSPAPVYSGADGTFRISEIYPGSYRVLMVLGTNALPEWVAPSVSATVEAGQKTRVEIAATRGGVLEIAVLEKTDHKPVNKAFINVHNPSFQASENSDAAGRAVVRLPAGQYQVWVSHLNSQHEPMSASVEVNTTNRMEIELNPAPKITGVVRDPSGAPVPGMELIIFPTYRANAGPLKTDAKGCYEMTWDPQRYSGMNESTCLLARDENRNLAAARDIEDGTTTLDLQLEPGLVLSGGVEDSSGKPLTNATIQLFLWSGNSGSSLKGAPFKVDPQGRFEISALPRDRRYSYFITAPGYGSESRQIQEGEAETNRLDLPHVVLQVADQILAGQVVDEEEKPVAKVRVSMHGPGQPNGFALTDAQGRFKFDQVCQGSIRLFANAQSAYGSAQCSGGDTNVILQLRSRGESYSMAPSTLRRSSLKGRPLPSLASCDLSEDCAPAGKPILLCLFDLEQRPSRRAIRSLAEQYDSLKQKGVIVLALQSAITTPETLKEWQQDNEPPFPVGRVTEKSDQAKWATAVDTLPWLILADGNHQVIAEGFPIDELEAKLQSMIK